MASISDLWADRALLKKIMELQNAQTTAANTASLGSWQQMPNGNIVGSNGYQYINPQQWAQYNPSFTYAGTGLVGTMTTAASPKKKKKLSEEFREEASRNPQAVLNQINGLLSAIKALHYA